MSIEHTAFKVSTNGNLIGKALFQGFLMAGNRHFSGGSNRIGRFENAFKDFYDRLDRDKKQAVNNFYSKVSSGNSQLKRRVFGRDINSLGASEISLSNLVTSDLLEFKYLQIHHITPSVSNTNCDAKLSLILKSVKIIESQDDSWTQSPIDEVSIVLMAIDEKGDLSRNTFDIGQLRENESGGINTTLKQFNICDSLDGFPKIYPCLLQFIEVDAGDYNELLNDYYLLIKKEINEEKIRQGVDQASQSSLSEETSNILASILKKSFDLFLKWVTDLFTNNDDFMGEIHTQCQINSIGQNRQSSLRTKTISAQGGRWRIQYYWKVVV